MKLAALVLVVLLPLLAAAIPMEQTVQSAQGRQDTQSNQSAAAFWPGALAMEPWVAPLSFLAPIFSFAISIVATLLGTGQIRTRSPGPEPEADPPAINWTFDPLANVPHYPWTPRHDINRPNHQTWNASVDFAYCLHVRPGTRDPMAGVTSAVGGRTYLSQNCTTMLHLGRGGENNPTSLHNVLPCGEVAAGGEVHGRNGTVVYKTLKVYLATDQWHNDEHCRAGCETCFDAMAEFGAEQAVCRRAIKFGAKCAMGVVSGEPPVDCGGKHALKDNVGGGRSGCKLKWDVPRWIEMGYSSYDQAMFSGLEKEAFSYESALRTDGDIRAYYVNRLPEVGAEVHGGWGKKQVLRHLLQGSTDTELGEGWLWWLRKGNWDKRDRSIELESPQTESVGPAKAT